MSKFSCFFEPLIIFLLKHCVWKNVNNWFNLQDPRSIVNILMLQFNRNRPGVVGKNQAADEVVSGVLGNSEGALRLLNCDLIASIKFS